ncbi:TPA: DEAD/DEAH box helicase [Acinetobacter baumannii]|nr:DEAD/DEAH box helicase [Acinetobacter baumannii]
MKNLGQYIFDEIESNDYFKSISDKILRNYASKIIDNKDEYSLDEIEEKNLFRFIDLLASTDNQKARMKAYHLISLCEPFLNHTERFKLYSSSVYSKLGLYALNIEEALLPFDRRFEIVAKKTNQKVDEKYIFTDTQYEIFTKMIKAPHFSFSGPTSLGKSFLIRRYIERIINRGNSNVVVLVPSKALINQFSSDIKTELESFIKDKNYIIQTHGAVINNESKSSFVFILTPERLISLFAKNSSIKIDFLFIDEAHKLSFSSIDDTRSLTAYTAIDKALERCPNIKLIFSSPNIANPEIFLELFGKDITNSIKVQEAPVAQNLYLIDFKFNNISCISNGEKIKLDIDILETVRDPSEFIFHVGKNNNANMVYCSSKEKAVKNAFDFYNKKVHKKILITENMREAIDKISSLVHQEYYLCKFLEKRIAYHHGQLPQIIRNIIEKLFRDGEIDFIFCTPTLVEGVNMPTKNIFINCDRKIRLNKGNTLNNPNKTIAFWNLAGRAGRYCKELSGNIFCIQNDSSERWDDLSIFDKEDNEILTSIDKVNNSSDIRKLKESLQLKDPNKENSNKIYDYFANLISIDIVRFKDNYNESFLLRKILDSNRTDLIELAEKSSKDILDVPLEIVDSFKSLNFSIQNKVYNYILKDPTNRKFPKIDYDNIKKVLFDFYKLYDWDIIESNNIKSIEQLDYYAVIMSKWVSGTSLNVMINDELRRAKVVYLERGQPPVEFNRSNLVHVNYIIDKLLSDIEKILTFVFEKYFNHYYKCLTYILGEDNAGHNWSTYLEYGTKNLVEIGLQNLGLSRLTAHNLVENTNLLKFISYNEEKNEIVSVNKQALLENIELNSLEYEEVIMYL